MRKFFTPDLFTPTKFRSAADKAAFGNDLMRFILEDFPQRLFTHKLYEHLNGCFGHIAHYDKFGFFEEWFSTEARKLEFLRHTLRYPCYGQPEFTYCDVENAIQLEVRRLNLLAVYAERVAAHIERTELAQLDRLQKKYRPADAIAIPEVPAARAPEAGIQLSLLA